MSQQFNLTALPRFGELDLPQFISTAPMGWTCCKDAQKNGRDLTNCRRCDHKMCSDCVVDSVEAEAAPADSDSDSEPELE